MTGPFFVRSYRHAQKASFILTYALGHTDTIEGSDFWRNIVNELNEAYLRDGHILFNIPEYPLETMPSRMPRFRGFPDGDGDCIKPLKHKHRINFLKSLDKAIATRKTYSNLEEYWKQVEIWQSICYRFWLYTQLTDDNVYGSKETPSLPIMPRFIDVTQPTGKKYHGLMMRVPGNQRKLKIRTDLGKDGRFDALKKVKGFVRKSHYGN